MEKLKFLYNTQLIVSPTEIGLYSFCVRLLYSFIT